MGMPRPLVSAAMRMLTSLGGIAPFLPSACSESTKVAVEQQVHGIPGVWTRAAARRPPGRLPPRWAAKALAIVAAQFAPADLDGEGGGTGERQPALKAALDAASKRRRLRMRGASFLCKVLH